MRAKKETICEATGTDWPNRLVAIDPASLFSEALRWSGRSLRSVFQSEPYSSRCCVRSILVQNGSAVLVACSREPRLLEAIDLGHASFVDDDLDGAEAKVFDLLPD